MLKVSPILHSDSAGAAVTSEVLGTGRAVPTAGAMDVVVDCRVLGDKKTGTAVIRVEQFAMGSYPSSHELQLHPMDKSPAGVPWPLHIDEGQESGVEQLVEEL